MNRAQYDILRSLRAAKRKAEKAAQLAADEVDATKDDFSPLDLWAKRDNAEGYVFGISKGLFALEAFIKAGEK